MCPKRVVKLSICRFRAGCLVSAAIMDLLDQYRVDACAQTELLSYQSAGFTQDVWFLQQSWTALFLPRPHGTRWAWRRFSGTSRRLTASSGVLLKRLSFGPLLNMLGGASILRCLATSRPCWCCPPELSSKSSLGPMSAKDFGLTGPDKKQISWVRQCHRAR